MILFQIRPIQQSPAEPPSHRRRGWLVLQQGHPQGHRDAAREGEVHGRREDSQRGACKVRLTAK